jgi:hypothetical protein
MEEFRLAKGNIQSLEVFRVMRVEIVKAWTQFPRFEPDTGTAVVIGVISRFHSVTRPAIIKTCNADFVN